MSWMKWMKLIKWMILRAQKVGFLLFFWFQITGELGQELKTQSGGIWQFCRLQLDQHLEAQKIDCLVVRLNHLEK